MIAMSVVVIIVVVIIVSIIVVVVSMPPRTMVWTTIVFIPWWRHVYIRTGMRFIRWFVTRTSLYDFDCHHDHVDDASRDSRDHQIHCHYHRSPFYVRSKIQSASGMWLTGGVNIPIEFPPMFILNNHRCSWRRSGPISTTEVSNSKRVKVSSRKNFIDIMNNFISRFNEPSYFVPMVVLENHRSSPWNHVMCVFFAVMTFNDNYDVRRVFVFGVAIRRTAWLW